MSGESSILDSIDSKLVERELCVSWRKMAEKTSMRVTKKERRNRNRERGEGKRKRRKERKGKKIYTREGHAFSHFSRNTVILLPVDV